MYEPFDYDEHIDEDGYPAKSRFKPREDFMSASRGGGPKKPSRWVFISRKADIGIVLVVLLGAGFGMMWFISQLPVFVETASNHYHWAKDVYATWGTPSMRWLFINLVVGVIVATSGLLSAFGGDKSSVQQTDRSTSGYDKGVSYRGPEAGVTYGSGDATYNASQPRFTGRGYESPHYNPYVDEPVKERLQHHESSSEEWNHPDDAHVDERAREESYHRRMHGPVDEPPFARPVDPEVMRAAKPVSRQGSLRRGVPMAAGDGVPMSSRELPREMFDTPRGGDMPRGEVPMSREIPRDMSPRESFREVPRDMPPMEEPPPSRETPMSKEIPAALEPAAVAEEVPRPPEPDLSEGSRSVGVSSSKEDAIEIISKVYDPVPEFEEVENHLGKFHRLKTDPGIHVTEPVDEASDGASPVKAEGLHKSHTFTLGRVIRRDQLVDFIEPLSRKLEGIGRKVSHKSSHSESGNLSREIEAVGSSVPQPAKHGRRLSAEAIPVVAHNRRLSSESVPSIEVNLPKMSSGPVIPNKFPSIVPKPSPPSPPLRHRSIVYPPALLSQASIAAAEELSPPSSPPIEEAVPPPPPPHLKLAATKDTDSSASMLSSEELPSFKFYVPPSDSPDPAKAANAAKKQGEKVSSSEDSKKPPSGKHSTKNSSTHIPSTSSQSAATLEAGGSSSGPDERSLMVKLRKSIAGDEKVQEIKEEPPLDRQESSSAKDDDLHQQIEDFLARFHENWRLQRQESLARYKKRLSELDDE